MYLVNPNLSMPWREIDRAIGTLGVQFLDLSLLSSDVRLMMKFLSGQIELWME